MLLLLLLLLWTNSLILFLSSNKYKEREEKKKEIERIKEQNDMEICKKENMVSTSNKSTTNIACMQFPAIYMRYNNNSV